jgi:hypothetical protein
MHPRSWELSHNVPTKSPTLKRTLECGMLIKLAISSLQSPLLVNKKEREKELAKHNDPKAKTNKSPISTQTIPRNRSNQRLARLLLVIATVKIPQVPENPQIFPLSNAHTYVDETNT